jgi:hypothetical protein
MASADLPPEWTATVDHVAITRLQARYADIITRRAWGELADVFVEDMPLRLDTGGDQVRELRGAAEIGGFIDAAVQRFSFFEFVPLNTHVELHPGGDGDLASARLWMCEVRCAADDTPDAGQWSTAFGLYRDDYVRLGDRWWFARRDYRSLARTSHGGTVLPFPDLP